MFNYLLKRLYLVVYPCKQRNLKIFKKGRVFVMNLSLVIITLVVLATFMIMAAVTDAVHHFQNRKNRHMIDPQISNQMDMEVGHR